MNEDICVWADGTWCFKDELWEMTHMSDDYFIIEYDGRGDYDIGC